MNTAHEHSVGPTAAWLAATDGTILWDPQTDQTSFEEGYLASLGWPPDARPSSWLDLVRPSDRGRVQEALESHLSGKTERFEAHYAVLRGDGSSCAVFGRGQVQARDEHGRPTAFRCAQFELLAPLPKQAPKPEERAGGERTEQPAGAGALSEELAAAAEGFSTMFWMRAADGSPRFFNRAWREYTGCSAEELSDEGWLDCIHPDDHLVCAAEYDAMLDERTPFEMKIRIADAAGSYRWFLDRGDPVFGPEGEFLGFVGFCTDIHAAEQDMRALYRTQFAVDRGVDPILWMRLDGRVVYANDRARALLDFQGEASQWSIRDVDPDYTDSAWSNLTSMVMMDSSICFETEYRAKGKAYLPVEVTVSLMKDADEELLIATVRDRTRHVEAEEILQKSEERFALAVAGATDGLWDWDLEHNRVWYSPRFRELLGYDADAYEEFPPYFESLIDAIHPEDLEETQARLNAHLERGESFDVRLRLRRSGGDYRWFRSRGKCIREAGSARRMAGSIQDVDDLLRQATALRRSNQDLDDFVQIVCTDLKEPLRGIANLAQWIEEDNAERLAEPSLKHLRSLRGRTARMGGLLDELLLYSRIGVDPGTAVDLDIAEEVAVLARELRERHSFQLHIRGDLPLVRGSKDGLQAVLRVLLSNALEHHDRERATIELVCRERSEHTLEFEVRDDGPGIEEEYRERVFRPFQTLQPRELLEGTGMGLAIAKKLVEQHGCTIAIEHNAPRGTAIRFGWPRSSGQDA